MEGKKINIYLVVANIAAFTYLFIGRFIELHDFLAGFCVGISIVFYPAGLFIFFNKNNKLRDYKRRLMGRPLE